MKATELQIGDWVNTDKFKLLRVVSIDGGTNTCWVDSTERSALYGMDTISPISLTPEILEKNGFTRTKFGYFNKKIKCLCGYYYVYVELDNHTIGCGEMYCAPEDVTECQWENEIYIPSGKIYVHTLQHALRLCGLSDIADNFKV